MNLMFLIKIMYFRNRLLAHDKWSRRQLEQYQAGALERLRTFVYVNSPFYQRFHKGLFCHPIEELPIITKKDLMDNFDEVITDRRMKLADLYAHLNVLTGNEKYLKNYSVSSTSGSTGLKGIFPFDENEWALASASYLRASEWAGVQVGLTKRLKVAVIGSTTPWHVSSRVGTSLNSWWVPTISLDAADPMDETVQKLNGFQPQCLMGYPSALRLLAEQQIDDNLRISPAAIFCTSEVLTEDSRERIQKAFGVKSFNVYAATETAGFASECSEHKGMHLYEDLVITEVVDEHNRPVPSGEYGKKILVTVLSGRTLPLIRYEMSDSVKIVDGQCECNLPFRSISDIQGRKEETLIFPDGYGDQVKLEPNLFHRIMELVPAAGWQIIQDTENSLRVLICQPRTEFSKELLVDKLTAELSHEKVRPEIFIEYVETLQLTETGKTLLIKSQVNK